jgi:hypothetical protein
LKLKASKASVLRSRRRDVSLETMMAKNEKTGTKAGKSASKVLRDGRTGKDSKTAAGSALSQRPDNANKKGRKSK